MSNCQLVKIEFPTRMDDVGSWQTSFASL